MQQSKTQKGLLSILEKFIRKNVILYYFVRNIVIYFNIFEDDFKILKKFYYRKPINIIDIGASDGIATNFFLKNLNVKKIFCYEPHKIFIEKLKKYKKNNKNIIIKEFGISHKTTKETIYYPIINFFGKRIPLLTYTFYNKKELIDQMKLDFTNYKNIQIKKSFINLKKYKTLKNKIDLIKIDIEGSEYTIMPEIIKNRDKIKRVICETHGNPNGKKIFNKEKTKKFIKNEIFKEEYLQLTTKLKKMNLYGSWFLEWY